MLNVSTQLMKFSSFLNDTWDTFMFFLKETDETDERMANLLQANWELLVETAICQSGEFLEQYGDGADLDECVNSNNSRITYGNAISTHKIVATPKEGRAYDYYSNSHISDLGKCCFNRFISIDTNGKFDNSPLFEYSEFINGDTQEIIVLKNTEVVYWYCRADSIV